MPESMLLERSTPAVARYVARKPKQPHLARKVHEPLMSCAGHSHHGLTCRQLAALLEAQGWRCALCPTARRLGVDHDHAVGRGAVRGVLCTWCNTSTMRLVDEGRWAASPRAQAYLDQAWWLTHTPQLWRDVDVEAWAAAREENRRG